MAAGSIPAAMQEQGESMSDINKLFRMAISALVFCTGLYVLLHQSKTYMVMLNTTREFLKESEVYRQSLAADRETITYAELIAALLHPLEYDILIDGILIRKDVHSLDKVAGYGIHRNDYKRSYIYDINGNVTRIVYTRKN